MLSTADVMSKMDRDEDAIWLGRNAIMYGKICAGVIDERGE